jgi:hypothetical protein
MREEYLPPPGFAKEPAEERRRWIGRILLAALLVFIGWLALERVINPPEDSPGPTQQEEPILPGPE